MQQAWQQMLVMHIGRRRHSTVRQAALAIHTNMQLHAEVPLPAFLRLVHFGITLLVTVPDRTWRGNDRCVDDRSRLERHAAVLQHPPSLCCPSKWRNRSCSSHPAPLCAPDTDSRACYEPNPGSPCAARRAWHCIPSRPNATPETVHNRL